MTGFFLIGKILCGPFVVEFKYAIEIFAVTTAAMNKNMHIQQAAFEFQVQHHVGS
jgi:hypothetical protein